MRRFSEMSALERVACANLGVIIAMNVSNPTTPTKHLLRQAKKVYATTTSKLGRWLVAMDKDYLFRIVMWRFSRNFEDLKTTILNDLDNGYESLQFVLRVAPKFMPSMICSALQQVACDYLWSKTIIENILRVWPLAAGSENDRKLFRDVLNQLYEYITKSLVTWLTQYGSSVPEESPFLQELGKVTDLLLKSVQCIAHHGSLRRNNRILSLRGLFTSRSIATDRQDQSRDSLKVKRRLSGFATRSQNCLEIAFADHIKCLRRDIRKRKKSIKCARWFALAVPQEARLLRSDSIASIPYSASTSTAPETTR